MLAFLNINGWEYMIIAVVVLVVVGPEELPSVLRKVGAFIRQFRDIGDKMRGEFMDGLNELDPTTWSGSGTDSEPIVPRGYAKELSAGGPVDRGVVKTESELAAERAAAASAAALAEAAPTDPWGRPIDPRPDPRRDAGSSESDTTDDAAPESIDPAGEASGDADEADEVDEADQA